MNFASNIFRNEKLKNFSLYSFAFLIGNLFCWKLIRLTTGSCPIYLWDIHVYVYLLCALSLVFLAPINKLMPSDYFLYAFLGLLGIPFLMNFSGPVLLMIPNFILPTFFYFLGRRIGYRKDYHKLFFRLLMVINGVVLFWSTVDFFSRNFISTGFIGYNYVAHYSKVFGRPMNAPYYSSVHQFLRIGLARTLGPTFLPHSSAALYAAIGFFHLAEAKNQYLKDKTIHYVNLLLALGFAGLAFLLNVGTVYLVSAIGVFFFFRDRKVRTAFTIIGGLMVPIIFAFRGLGGNPFQVFVDYGFIFKQGAFKFFRYFFLGDGAVGGPVFANGEVYLLSLIFCIGIFAFLALFMLLFLSYRTYAVFYRRKIRDYQSFFLFLLIIFLCSIHYNSTFRFPSIIYVFTFIGFLAGDNLRVSEEQGSP